VNPRLDRATRAVAVAAVLVGLLVVVALTSSRNRPRVSDGSDPGAVADVRDIFLTVGGTLYAVAFVYAAWAFWKYRGAGGGGTGPRLSLRAFLLFVMFVIGVTWLIRFRGGLTRLQGEDGILFAGKMPQIEAPPAQQPAAPEPLPPTDFRWGLAAALVAVIVGAMVAAVIVRRRRAAQLGVVPLSAHELAAAELATIVDGTLDDLRREADPRRAVIAAYAQMERALARHGLPREPSEAPFEYLARLLRELRVRAASALALTELFERARFSDHAIDAAMKDEAIEALVAVREDLRPA
jgi:hypothetical protein